MISADEDVDDYSEDLVFLHLNEKGSYGAVQQRVKLIGDHKAMVAWSQAFCNQSSGSTYCYADDQVLASGVMVRLLDFSNGAYVGLNSIAELDSLPYGSWMSDIDLLDGYPSSGRHNSGALIDMVVFDDESSYVKYRKTAASEVEQVRRNGETFINAGYITHYNAAGQVSQEVELTVP